MKTVLLALCALFALDSLNAQKPLWQPSAGHTQVPIWPGPVPDPQPVAGPEFAETLGKGWLVAGRPAVEGGTTRDGPRPDPSSNKPFRLPLEM
ncbi:MAG TPA: hypothetical protein DEQ47_05805 [Solibacterales bacterium]|nr:hypothetical protein [Bryobacterales bacterium]